VLCYFLEVLAWFPKVVYTTFITHCFGLKTVGMYFEASIQHFGGTKIEEQTCNLLQKILERILRSLTLISCVKTWHGYRDKFVI
jgi:hypothetical protein